MTNCTQVRDKKKGVDHTWVYVANGSCTADDFPKVPGPMGQPRQLRRQMEVIKGFKYTGLTGDLLKAYRRLYPGNIANYVAKINVAMKLKDPKARDLTEGEFILFDGLLIAATFYSQSGHALWTPPASPRRFHPHPNFGQFMRRGRFDAIKGSVHAAYTDPTMAGEDPWYEIRPLIDAFNENRLENVVKSEFLIPDEAMSPYQPRTTPAGDLDHLSFVERKPKKLGTEFKCVADGAHGLMLFLEIQEGQERMALRRFRDSHAPATAQALRLALGVNGK